MTRRYWLMLAAAALAVLPGCHKGGTETGGTTAPPADGKSTEATKPAAGGTDPMAELKDGKEYKNAEKHFSISFPANWTVSTDQAGVIVSAKRPVKEGDTFAPNANVTAEKIPDGMDSDKYVEAALKPLSTITTDFTKVEEHHSTIDGKAAYWYVLTYTVNKVAVQTVLTIVPANGQGFAITCTAKPEQFKDVRETFEGICHSFKAE